MDLWLDVLQEESDRVRERLGVATLSTSCVDRDSGSLRTLVNTGALCEQERRRPAGEIYPLTEFPAAAALVLEGRPYVIGPEAGDPASLDLGARLEKTSQAAVPIYVNGVVWGELWAASTADELPLSPAELPLLDWAAGVLHGALDDILPDLARLLPCVWHHRYELWLDGYWDDLAAIGGEDPIIDVFDDLTRITAVLDRASVHELLEQIHAAGIELVCLRRDTDLMLLPRRRGRSVREYALRFAGSVPGEPLRIAFDVTVSHVDGATVITGCVGPDMLHMLLRRAFALEAELVAIVSLG